MLAFLLLFAILTPRQSAPAPVCEVCDIANNVQTIGWVSPPNVRGTSNILFSCLSTLVLCVWTSLHFDIPLEKPTLRKDTGWMPWHLPVQVERGWRRFHNNFGWLMMGIFAPELVVFVAGSELRTALELSSSISELPHNVRPREWTLRHSFYAIMGGFALDYTPGISQSAPPIPWKMDTLPLSGDGVLALLRCGQKLPPLSEQRIKDKSKSDILSKLLTCAQATWMIIQILSRKAGNLPITLLEVNTLVHALCALAIYSIWWYKPQGVRESTTINDEDTKCICAYAFMKSKEGHHFIQWIPSDEREMDIVDHVDEAKRIFQNTLGSGDKESALVVEGDLDLDSEAISWNPPEDILKFFEVEASTVSFSHRDLHRWKLASNAKSILNKSSKVLNEDDSGPFMSHMSNLLSQMQRVSDANGIEGAAVLFLGIVALSAVYGGIHATAWHAFFPSSIERILWRSSSLFIAGFGVWYFSSLYLINTIDAGIFEPATGWISLLSAPLWLAARVFLVVEAFISLRRLPIEAYHTPDWTQFLPHL